MSSPSSAKTALSSFEGASLVPLLLILRRRWRLIAIVWATTVAAAAVYTFTTPRLYRPQASLEIRPETPLISSETRDSAMMASQQMWENYYRTQEQILTSPTLLEAAMQALPEAIRKEYAGLADPVKAFSERLDIEKVRTSFIIKVGFVDKSPETATQVVNTLVTLYLDDANHRLREVKSGQVELLSKEALPSIRARVDEADRKIQEFQKQTGFMDFEEHYKLLIEKYRRFDSAKTDIELKKRKLRTELDALAEYGGDGISGLFNPAFHATRSLEQLAEQRSRIATELAKQARLLKDKHPAVLELRAELQILEDKIREAVRGTLKAIESDYAQVELEERALSQDLARVSKQMEEVGSQKWKYKQLEGDIASAKDLYSSYLKKHGETAATSGATLGSVRVVDHATVPLVPYKPKLVVNLGLALLLGGLFAAGAVLVIEQLDDRIVSSQEIEAFLGLDVLASIPKLDQAGRAGASPVLLGSESSLAELEAFRGLRAEVRTRMEGRNSSKVLAILSANQSEGKSTVTANLASVLALEGTRVLIFDADLRRPSMIGLVGIREGPDLTDVLKGGASVESAIQKTRIEGVDVIGAREGISSAPELTGGPRLDAAIQYGRDHYDLVLVDSAPVIHVSESALVARRADAVIMVVRELQTGRSSAQLAIKRLRGMRVNLIGAVLNCAKPQLGIYGSYYYTYGVQR